MSAPVEFKKLAELWRNSTGVPGDELAAKMAQLPIETPLSQALQTAVQGDNRPLNTWLFEQGAYPSRPVAWIAPVSSAGHRYVWMVGETNATAVKMHSWFVNARKRTRNDALLQQKLIPPPLLFVNPAEVSKVTTNEAGLEDEFAIFQVGYKNAVTEVSDLEQRMVINSRLSVSKRREALLRLRYLCPADDAVLQVLEANIELFSLLHNEGHNQGHFVGAWPHDEVYKKTILYEAVEEFRACLAAILLAEHLPLSEIERTAFSVSVLMTRFLGFGFESYCLTTQRRETVREITVGLFFFEWLLDRGVLKVETSGQRVRLSIDYGNMRAALILAFHEIYNREATVLERNEDALVAIATDWYKLGFPGATYSQSALSVYNDLIDHERR